MSERYIVVGKVAIHATDERMAQLHSLLVNPEDLPERDGVGFAITGCAEGFDCPDALCTTEYVWVPVAAVIAVTTVLPPGVVALEP